MIYREFEKRSSRPVATAWTEWFRRWRRVRNRRRVIPAAVLPERLESRRLLTLYEVGPGLDYTTIGAVPWDNLGAGDTVQIHYRPEPYHELIFLSGHGTADAPIRIEGIAGPNGERPIIDGEDAVMGPNLNYVYSGLPTRGLVTISIDNNEEYGDKPEYIEVSGLEVRNAHLGNSFTRPDNSTSDYLNNAAGIYVERGEHITIRDCEIDHNSNGLFVASGDEEALQSRNILIQGNYIHDNGNVDSDRQHNVYTEAIGITYEDNHFGPLLPGSGGANLKDRSAGLVVRNNWIEGGAYLMDLVDAEGSFSQAGSDPSYYQTFVYGNVLLDTAGDGNASNLIHYGGDSGDTSIYRNGTLYFYQNTVVIQGRRTGPDARYFTDVFRLETLQQNVDARNNIFYAMGDPDAPGEEPTGLALLDYRSGNAHFENNWISPGWHTWRLDDAQAGSVITGTENFITNQQNNPGFQDISSHDFRLTEGSQSIDQSSPLAAAVVGNYDPDEQYVVHQGEIPRVMQGSALDLGAFEGPVPLGPGHFQFQSSSQTVQENGGVAHITVTRSGGTTGAATVHYATIDGSAHSPADYTATSGTIQFADGQSTAQIDVAILDNLFAGPDKSLQLQLSNATDGATLGNNATLTLKIHNDESATAGPSSAGFTKTSYSTSDSAGQLILTIRRDGDLSVAAQVTVATKAKSAKAGTNFVGLTQNVHFDAGQQTQQVVIQLLNQSLGKKKRIFNVELTSASGGVTLNKKAKSAKVTLTD